VRTCGRGFRQLHLPKAVFEVRHERRAPLGSRAMPLLGAQAVDAALDLGSESMRLTASRATVEIAAACLPHLALAAMSATFGRPAMASRVEQRVVSAMGVGLQDAAEAGQMLLKMFVPPVAGGVVEHSRRRPTAELIFH